MVTMELPGSLTFSNTPDRKGLTFPSFFSISFFTAGGISIILIPIIIIVLIISCTAYMTEKYKPEPGLEPRVSRLAHEHSTTELFKRIQLCYLIKGVLYSEMPEYFFL